MFRSFLQFVYDRTLRPRTSRRLQIKNGVAVPHPHRLLDIEYERSDYDYECPLLDQLRRVVGPNDDVLIVGGGFGVSMVLAAEHSYPDGRVHVVEASVEQVSELRDLAEVYGIANRVTVIHGTVGDPRNVYGELGSPLQVEPDDLPVADVFILDCEGGEGELLPALGKLDHKPRVVVVETHGEFGTPPDQMFKMLAAQDYEVRRTGIENANRGMEILRGDRR